jgi:hypothetical protein
MSGIEIKDIWNMVPMVKCQGRCVASCGPIQMSKAERELLPEWFPSADQAMDEYTASKKHWHCPLLVDGKCSEYKVRPLICRLWGAEKSLPCPYGCEVIGGPLSHEEGSSLMQIIMEVGGGPA